MKHFCFDIGFQQSPCFPMVPNASQLPAPGRSIFRACNWIRWGTGGLHIQSTLPGGWTNPSEKRLVKLDHLPKNRGEYKECLEPPSHLYSIIIHYHPIYWDPPTPFFGVWDPWVPQTNPWWSKQQQHRSCWPCKQMHLHVQWTISSHGCQWYDSFEPREGTVAGSLGSNIQWIWETHTLKEVLYSTTFRNKTYWLSFNFKWMMSFSTRKWLQCLEASARDIKDGMAMKMIDHNQQCHVSMVCCTSPIIKIKTWLPLRWYPTSGFHYSSILQHIANHVVQ